MIRDRHASAERPHQQSAQHERQAISCLYHGLVCELHRIVQVTDVMWPFNRGAMELCREVNIQGVVAAGYCLPSEGEGNS